jgi:hypothetical protein
VSEAGRPCIRLGARELVEPELALSRFSTTWGLGAWIVELRHLGSPPSHPGYHDERTARGGHATGSEPSGKGVEGAQRADQGDDKHG